MPDVFPGVTTVVDALSLGTAEWLSYWFERSNNPWTYRDMIKERFPSMGKFAIDALISRAANAYLAGVRYETDEGAGAPVDPTLPNNVFMRAVVEASFPDLPDTPIRVQTIDLGQSVDWESLRQLAEEDVLRAAQIAMLKASGRRCAYIDLGQPSGFASAPRVRVISVWVNA